MDWLEKQCIRCDEGGNLLACSGNCCPILVHEECMGCPAQFNDAGNFCCPYCVYKEAVSEMCRAREDAMEKKKALLLFIGEDPKNGENLLEEEEYEKSQGKMHNQSNDAAADDTVVDRSMGNVGEDSVTAKDMSEGKIPDDDDEDLEVESILGDDDSKSLSVEEDECVDASSESKDQNPSFQSHEEPKEDDEVIEDDVSAASAESIRVEDSPIRAGLRSNREGTKRSHTDEADDDTVPLQGKRTKTSNGDKDEQACEENVGTPRRSSRRTVNKDKQTCEETEDTPRRSSRRSSVSSPGNDEDADRISEPPQQQQTSVRPARKTFGNAKKRTPLLWSKKEEEILKKGVSKYSEPDRKIPWKKILEYGRKVKVFHITRTPIDLKDKWRKILATK